MKKKTRVLLVLSLIFIAGLTGISSFYFFANSNNTHINQQLVKPPFKAYAFQEKTLPEVDTQMGIFHFPKANVSVPLIYGYNDAYMNQYFDEVGLEAWGNLPGEDNKLYINGHRHLAFQSLKDIVIGDTIILETNYGKFTYEVQVEPHVVLASDQAAIDFYLNDHDTAYSPQILRLQTCYPFPAGSTLDHRYLVDLVLIDSEYFIV